MRLLPYSFIVGLTISSLTCADDTFSLMELCDFSGS